MTDHPRHRTPHPVRCLLHASIEDVVWIRTISWDESDGVLRAAYDWQASRLGEPAEFTMLGSLYPEVVEERLRLYRVVEGCPSALSGEERAGRVRHLAAQRHGPLRIGAPPSPGRPRLVAGAGRRGRRPTEVRTGSPRLDAVAAHAAKLTTEPTAMSAADIERLRSVGLDDLEVLDLNNVVAYYNYINRARTASASPHPLPHDALHAPRTRPRDDPAGVHPALSPSFHQPSFIPPGLHCAAPARHRRPVPRRWRGTSRRPVPV